MDEEGTDSGIHDALWAQYLIMAGEIDSGLERLEKSIRRGSLVGTWAYNIELEPLARDPRFIAIRKMNRDAINAEREKLGWEPVDKVGDFMG